MIADRVRCNPVPSLSITKPVLFNSAAYATAGKALLEKVVNKLRELGKKGLLFARFPKKTFVQSAFDMKVGKEHRRLLEESMNAGEHNLKQLYPHEFQALLEAVRRDMRAELHLSQTRPDWADWHRLNARHDRRLLEVLNPKRPCKGLPQVDAATGQH